MVAVRFAVGFGDGDWGLGNCGAMVLCIDERCSKGRGIMEDGRWKMVGE